MCMKVGGASPGTWMRICLLACRKHSCQASPQLETALQQGRRPKESSLKRQAGRLFFTCKLGPLHCQVAALHKLQPVLNRQPAYCASESSCRLLAWRLTQPAAEVCQRLAAPLTACREGALQGPQLSVPA